LHEGAGGSSNPCPFDITLTPEGGNYRLTIHPGTINNILPSNYLSGITFAQNGTFYICLDVLTSSAEIVSCSLIADSNLPIAPKVSPNSPPTSFKYLIGIVIDG